MEVIEQVHVTLADSSGIGQARRAAQTLARRAGFGEESTGRVALVVTEAASNVMKHGGGGELLIHRMRDEEGEGIDVLAIDRGPGISDLGQALRDGVSTTGTAGTGLGAISRLSSVVDMYSRAGAGVVLFARLRRAAGSAPAPRALIGGLNVPHPLERVSGDAWTVRHAGALSSVLVADGLGHGAEAAEASGTARTMFRDHPGDSPHEALERIHSALVPTRGAAVAVAEIDRARRVVRFAGVGNVSGTILVDATTRSTVSHHGTAGHDARKIQQFTYPWPEGATLVMHSDGLSSRWKLSDYPGLGRRHPMLLAAVLYRDHRRGRDDASVVVLRDAP